MKQNTLYNISTSIPEVLKSNEYKNTAPTPHQSEYMQKLNHLHNIETRTRGTEKEKNAILPPLLRFAEYMINAGYSYSSIYQTSTTIKRFLREAYKKQLDYNTMDIPQILDIINTLVDTPSRQKRTVGEINAFYRYLNTNFNIPLKHVNLPKVRLEKRMPFMLQDEHVKLLGTTLHNKKNCGVFARTKKDISKKSLRVLFKNIRNLLIFKTLVVTAIRVSELTNIRYCDIDLNNNKILIHGKGKKERIVYFNKSLHDTIIEYTEIAIAMFGEWIDVTNGSLFMTQSASVPSPQYIKHVVSDWKKIIQTKYPEVKRLGPHDFRRYTATKLAEKGINMFAIQAMLGHDNIQTTSRYVMMGQSTYKKEMVKAFDIMDEKE